jgi:soluble cytochrome b562/uncharacterized membrane protein
MFALGLLLKFLPPDGTIRPGFLLFLGRFHPLVVHLPIAFVLLIPVFELPLPFLERPARRVTLAILVFSAIATLIGAIVLGWLLAYAGGFQGTLLMQHAWAAVITGTLLSMAALLWNRDFTRIAFTLASVASISLTGHLGGELTHGTTYLSEYAPEPIRSLIGAVSEKSDTTVYSAFIAPAFKRSCVQCHNSGTANGGLDLSSLKGLMKGGEEGPAIIPGKPAESLLIKRVCLAPDDRKSMPPAPKQPLTPAELSILRAWIASGAKADMELSDLSGLPPEGKNLVASRRRALRPKPPEIADPTKSMPDILAAAKSAGVRIAPISANPREGLALQTFGQGTRFDDSKFATITPAAPFLVEAGLADSGITDSSLEGISSFQSLRRVDLSRTAVTGSGVSKVLSLPSLEVLILTGTGIDDAWLQGSHPGASLRTLGLFQTKVTQPAVAAFQKTHSKLTVYGPIKVSPPPLLASPTPMSSPGNNQESPLEKQMRILADGMKRLGTQINDPAKQADTVKLIDSLKQAALVAKSMDPTKTATVAASEKETFLADYRAQLDKLASAFDSIETAAKEGRYDQAKALLSTVAELRKEGHAKFKAAAPASSPSPSPSSPAALNTLCPFSKKPVVESTLLEANGWKIAFCCQDCRQKFLSHPESQAEILKSVAP